MSLFEPKILPRIPLSGHAELDADHMRLEAMLDGLFRAIEQGSRCECIRQAMTVLSALREEYAQEESTMARLGFPGLGGHRRGHAALETRFNGMARALAAEEHFDGPHREQLLIQLREFTVALIEHVLHADCDLARFLGGRAAA